MDTIKDGLKKLQKHSDTPEILSESKSGYVAKSNLQNSNFYIDGNEYIECNDKTNYLKPRCAKSFTSTYNFGTEFDSAYDFGNNSDVYFDSKLVNFNDDKFTNNSSSVKDMFFQKMNLYKNFLDGDFDNLANNGMFSHLREKLVKEFEKIYQINIEKDITKLIEYEKKRTPFVDQADFSRKFEELKLEKQNCQDIREDYDIHDSPIIAAKMLKKRVKELGQEDKINMDEKIEELLKKGNDETNKEIINQKHNISFNKLRDICYDIYEQIEKDFKEINELNEKITKYAKQFDKYNDWILNTQNNIDDCEDVCELIEKKIENWFTKSDVIGNILKYQELKKKRNFNEKILSIFRIFAI